jgi:hypothetical protein
MCYGARLKMPGNETQTAVRFSYAESGVLVLLGILLCLNLPFPVDIKGGSKIEEEKIVRKKEMEFFCFFFRVENINEPCRSSRIPGAGGPVWRRKGGWKVKQAFFQGS